MIKDNKTMENIIEINIGLGDLIQRNPNFKTAEIDDELVCIDESTGAYIGINCTGKLILEILEDPLPISTVIDKISEKFPEENIEQLVNDLFSFINNLLSLNILLLLNLQGRD